jgi:hypothetical protein
VCPHPHVGPENVGVDVFAGRLPGERVRPVAGGVAVHGEERVAHGDAVGNIGRKGQPVECSVREAEEGAVAEGDPWEQRGQVARLHHGAPGAADGTEADAVGVGRYAQEDLD